MQGTDAQADSCSGVSISRAGGLRVVRAGQGPREGLARYGQRAYLLFTPFNERLQHLRA